MKKRKQQLQSARHHGASRYEEDRGPNTGRWEKLFTGWAPGARLKYSRVWNSGYDSGSRGSSYR